MQPTAVKPQQPTAVKPQQSTVAEPRKGNSASDDVKQLINLAMTTTNHLALVVQDLRSQVSRLQDDVDVLKASLDEAKCGEGSTPTQQSQQQSQQPPSMDCNTIIDRMQDAHKKYGNGTFMSPDPQHVGGAS